ncbi:hypothetical protein MSG28_010476 [Choristoneura fumiferana]|uniref:Uncharacterized protein n=1 Tax=Choristoneura fumiferana TaxID=7141 RepID=A0ACC0KKK8_CHOFU|nr:hypothetical protein MSG28_010476 [Choristoneura fumiferana]
MSLENVYVKEEPEWEEECGESAEASQEDLYPKHEFKQELAIGPEVHQPQNVTYLIEVSVKQEVLDVKQEPVEPIENKPVVCTTCHNIFEDESSRASHTCTKIKEEIDLDNNSLQIEIVKLSCDLCELQFEDENLLAAHVKMHTAEKLEPYPCDICSKRFMTNDELKLHVTVHKVGEAFCCELCSKQFRRKSALKRHIFFHTAEKSYSCEICDRKFTTKAYLAKHIKQFDKKINLARHVRRLHKAKRFTCDICDKQFTFASDLRRHEPVHMEEKPCPVCEKKFTHKSSLIRHMQTHARGFACDICHKSFSDSSALDKHKESHTKDTPHQSYPTLLREMSLDSVHIKEEPVWEVPCSVSDGTLQTELYADHDIKEELTVGPEVLQPQDVTYSIKVPLKQEVPVDVKQEPTQSSDTKPVFCKTCYRIFEQESSLLDHLCIIIEEESDLNTKGPQEGPHRRETISLPNM